MNTMKLEQEANAFISALKKEVGELPNALKELQEKGREAQHKSYLTKLPKLVYTLTNVTKKKSIREKYKLPDKAKSWTKEEVEIGINCNGLGIVDWGSQLTPLANDYKINSGYEVDDENLKILLWIFNDEELCLDIADNILNKNRKNFLALASYFRKQEIKPEELKKTIIIDDILIKFNGLWSLDVITHKTADVSLNWRSKDVLTDKAIDTWELISECRINELLFLGKIVENKDRIINEIKHKISALEDREKRQEELNSFVNNMVIPYEALEEL